MWPDKIGEIEFRLLLGIPDMVFKSLSWIIDGCAPSDRRRL